MPKSRFHNSGTVWTGRSYIMSWRNTYHVLGGVYLEKLRKAKGTKVVKPPPPYHTQTHTPSSVVLRDSFRMFTVSSGSVDSVLLNAPWLSSLTTPRVGCWTCPGAGNLSADCLPVVNSRRYWFREKRSIFMFPVWNNVEATQAFTSSGPAIARVAPDTYLLTHLLTNHSTRVQWS